MENLANTIFLIGGFILWLGYIFIEVSKEINTKNSINIPYVTYFRKNIHQFMRLDKLILLIVFYFYTKMQNQIVSIYLFDMIILFFLVNLFYEDIHFKKINFLKEKYYYIIIYLIGVLPIIYYIITKESIITLIIIAILMYCIPLLFALINKFIKIK